MVFLSLNLFRLFLFLTYLKRLGLLVVFMYYPECRDLGFGIDSLANVLGRFRKVLESFDLGRRIDELKEQKVIIIVGDPTLRESCGGISVVFELQVDVSEPCFLVVPLVKLLVGLSISLCDYFLLYGVI